MELKIVCPQESFVDYIHKAGKLTLVFFFVVVVVVVLIQIKHRQFIWW